MATSQGSDTPPGGPKAAWASLGRAWKVTAGVLGALVLISGAVTAVNQAANWWAYRSATSSPTPSPSQLDRTPVLGIQFWQGAQQASMTLQTDSAGLETMIDVYLKRVPFYVWFPAVGANDEIQIVAWTDKSIFTIPRDAPIPDGPPFGWGTGIADYNYKSGTLILTKEGHNALFGSGLASAGNGMQKTYISTLWIGRAPAGVPIAQAPVDVYVAVYIDKNHDNKFDWGDYEYIRLRFQNY